jgi:uncharacterized protein
MRRSALVLAALLLGAPAHADNAKPGTAKADTAKPPPAPVTATPAMWTVKSATATVYLLGSFHELPKNVDWHTDQIKAAIKSAQAFVFEVPMDKDDQTRAGAIMGANMLLPLDVSLPSFFDDEMRDNYRQVIMNYQIDPQWVVYMRPWLAALYLEGAASGLTGLRITDGVDNVVYREAAARGVKDFRASETHDMHIQLYTNGLGNPDGELAELRAVLADMVKHKPDDKALLAAWEKGDIKALTASGPDNPQMSPQAKKVMLDDRNQAWIPQIQAMLKEHRTILVTVGAAHLVGKGGVPNLLRAAGYHVDGPDNAAAPAPVPVKSAAAAPVPVKPAASAPPLREARK